MGKVEPGVVGVAAEGKVEEEMEPGVVGVLRFISFSTASAKWGEDLEINLKQTRITVNIEPALVTLYKFVNIILPFQLSSRRPHEAFKSVLQLRGVMSKGP